MSEFNQFPTTDLYDDLEKRRTELQDTVDRGAEALAFDDEEIRELLVDAVRDEQQTSFDALQTAASEIAWEDMGRADLTMYEEVTALDELFGEESTHNAEELAKLDETIARAIHLAPAVKDKVIAVAEKRRAEIAGRTEAEYKQERLALQARHERIQEAIMATGVAWPLPNLVEVKPVITKPESSVEPTAAPVPVPSKPIALPGPTKAKPTKAPVPTPPPATKKTAAKKAVPTPPSTKVPEVPVEVSKTPVATRIGDLLADCSKEVIDINALAGVLEAETADSTLTHDQTIELFRGDHGQEIAAKLAERGLVAIHGWRLTRTSEGVSRERILKLVGSDAVTDDAFEGVRVDEEGSEVFLLWITDINDDQLEEREDLFGESAPEVESVEEPAPTVQLKAVPTPKAVTPAPRKVAAKKTPAKKTAAKKTSASKEKVDWQKDFKQRLGATMQKLEEHGLLSEDPMSTATLGNLSRNVSRKIATSESKARAIGAGILPRNAAEETYTFSAVEIILLEMFNSNRPILSQKTRQKEAIAIVEAAVGHYFERKHEEEQPGAEAPKKR